MHQTTPHQGPDERTLRQFAGLCLLFFGSLAAWHGLYRGQAWLGTVLAILAIGLGLPGLARPLLLRWLFVGWMRLTYPVSWLVSHLLLAAMFYGLFTPLGLFFRLIRRDPLKLRMQPRQPSYWEPKPSAAGVSSYFRQF